MTTKNTVKVARISVSDSAHEKFTAYGNVKATLESMADFLPVYDFCKVNGISLEDALHRLSSEPVKEVITINRHGKNRDEFSKWLEKLVAYNESAIPEYRVFITQRLFLNLIGGNVNTISSAYKEHEKEIGEHNAKMNTNDSTNRSLSHKIRSEHGNKFKSISEWLESIVK